MNETKTELKLIHMEDVISKEVSWLWYPYIPFGKITVIEGDGVCRRKEFNSPSSRKSGF